MAGEGSPRISRAGSLGGSLSGEREGIAQALGFRFSAQPMEVAPLIEPQQAGSTGALWRRRLGRGRSRALAAAALLLLGGLVALVALILRRRSAGRPPVCQAHLALSLPTNTSGFYNHTGDPHLWDTADSLVDIIGSARHHLAISAMYWNLVGIPEAHVPPDCEWGSMSNPCPADAGFTKAQFKALGSEKGAAVFQAISDAAHRGVSIRIVQARGMSGEKLDFRESEALGNLSKKVEIRILDMPQWYDSGIMHMKMVIVDTQHVYIGSANMDWKSMSQVKELGVVMKGCGRFAGDAQALYDHFWRMAAMPVQRELARDPALNVKRNVPCWSELVTVSERCKKPWKGDRLGAGADYRFSESLGGDPTAVSHVRLSCSPPELCEYGRLQDQQMLVDTIGSPSEGGYVYLSVMDFDIVSDMPGEPVYWPPLVKALYGAALSQGATVRVLVSHWSHSSPSNVRILQGVQETFADLCKASSCSGSLEIRKIEIPGWDHTDEAGRPFPGFTRVAHSKYIVTDTRLNIGTSNMAWGYFHSTAGTSFNTNNTELIDKVSRIFLADWDHSHNYTTALSTT